MLIGRLRCILDHQQGNSQFCIHKLSQYSTSVVVKTFVKLSISQVSSSESKVIFDDIINDDDDELTHESCKNIFDNIYSQLKS